jgi:TadE-like protein
MDADHPSRRGGRRDRRCGRTRDDTGGRSREDDCGRSHEDGSVTAETAVVTPVVAAFALCLCWLVSLGIAQVQLVDAARDGAREVARGERVSDVEARVHRSAPGAHTTIVREDELVSVSVVADVESPPWLLVPLPTVTLRAESSVLSEEDADALP